MKPEITKLRKYMEEAGLGAYLVNSADCHGSEYTHERFHVREFLTGFTGSNGTLVVTADEALLWTDSRYFEQAELQLAGSGITLMKMGEEGVPSISGWISKVEKFEYNNEDIKLTLGLDASTVTFDFVSGLKSAVKNIEIVDVDLADKVWEDRPALDFQPVRIFEDAKSVARKIQDVRYIVKNRKLTKSPIEMDGNSSQRGNLLTADLTEIAWMLGLRGADIEFNPVFYAYMILNLDSKPLTSITGKLGFAGDSGIILYANEASFDKDARRHLAKLGVTLKAYDDFYNDAPKILRGKKVLITPDKVSQKLYDLVKEVAEPVMGPSPITRAKAIKSAPEIEQLRQANIIDGVAMTKFIYWIKNRAREQGCENGAEIELGHMTGTGELSELAAAQYLDNLRVSLGAAMPSFETIMAYGAHSSIVHYSARDAEAARIRTGAKSETIGEEGSVIKPNGLLLVDSGAHYMGAEQSQSTTAAGTTDVTRTIALGEVTQEMKHAYTLVLQGHIDLAMAHFPEGTDGAMLDKLARKYLQNEGLDFGHGTGHGIGFALSVHEGPQAIHRKAHKPFVPGMVTSDEPGVYFPGKFGIRIENDLLCVENKSWTTYVFENSKKTPMFDFENLTLVPYEPELTLWERLTDSQRIYLKEYNERLVDEIGPHLEADELEWLKSQINNYETYTS